MPIMVRGIAICVLTSLPLGCGSDTATKSTAQSSFSGTSLRLSIEKGSPLTEALRLRVPEWEARTGAKVTVTEDATVDLDADVAACSGTALAELPGRRFLSAEFKKKPDVGFIHIPYLHQTAFGARSGEAIAVPLGVEQLLLWYRADLFANEKLKASFKERFNLPLDPPKTWDDYVRVARFFQESKTVKFGCVEAFSADAEGLRGLFARAASFSEDPRSTPFDVSDGRSRLGDPEYAKAAQYLLVSLAYSPAKPGVKITGEEARQTFAAGDAAMILFASPPASHPSLKLESGFADKLGVAPLPTSPLVYSAKSKTWRDRNQKGEIVPSAPYLASTGHYLSVSDNSNSVAAAQDLVAFLVSMNDSAYLVQGARMGLTPAREEMLNDSGRFTGGYGQPGKLTAEYFNLVREGLRPARWATDLRVEKSAAFLKPLFEELLTKVRAGSAGLVVLNWSERDQAAALLSAAEAMRKVDGVWKAELANRGETFVEEFRMSQGFSPRMK